MHLNPWILGALCASMLSANTLLADETQSYVHEQTDASGYVWPKDKAVLDQLSHWQNQKFGVLIHFGIYSVPGIVESWSICSEDWITRPEGMKYDEYKKWYFSLADSLNPTKFNPAQWADACAGAGARYMIFTTKHHDGFCNFDSKLTDYTIKNGPFGSDPRSNVAKEVFQAFRDKDFMIGCYFSKPDWHCQWFWNDTYATPNRHVNYNKKQHPDWWKNYQEFTCGQLRELLGGDYGRFDLLWLDGGWIAGQDFGLSDILAEARADKHPGMLSVDRTIGGPDENYQTPERGIPAQQLTYPWESCIPLSNDWGWVPNAPYKSANKVIAMLAQTVAKGGNLVLGVGPTPEGLIEEREVSILKEIGAWLDANGEAIFNTTITPVYNEGDVWFTQSHDGKHVYAIYAPADGEIMPETISWTGNVPSSRPTMLASGKKLRYKADADGRVTVTLPRGTKPGPLAVKIPVSK